MIRGHRPRTIIHWFWSVLSNSGGASLIQGSLGFQFGGVVVGLLGYGLRLFR